MLRRYSVNIQDSKMEKTAWDKEDIDKAIRIAVKFSGVCNYEDFSKAFALFHTAAFLLKLTLNEAMAIIHAFGLHGIKRRYAGIATRNILIMLTNSRDRRIQLADEGIIPVMNTLKHWYDDAEGSKERRMGLCVMFSIENATPAQALIVNADKINEFTNILNSNQMVY